MKKIPQAAICLLSALVLLLSSCDKDFLERYPSGSLVESNAFQTYDNYRAYMYKCYGLFTDKRILTNYSVGWYHCNGQYYSDHFSGIMGDRDLWENPYAMQTVATVTSSSYWDFGPIRSVNIMLSHLDDGYLTETEQANLLETMESED